MLANFYFCLQKDFQILKRILFFSENIYGIMRNILSCDLKLLIDSVCET